MLTRKRYREVPPRVDYELTERARELAPVLGELARWGYEWAWGPPRPAERVDVGAIFRLIPGLVHDDGLQAGTVELTVTDGHDGQPISYLVTLSSGDATVAEGPVGKASAYLRGNTDAWIRALSPRQDRGGLRKGGDRGLADTVLSLFAPAGSREITQPNSATA